MHFFGTEASLQDSLVTKGTSNWVWPPPHLFFSTLSLTL